MLWGRLSMRQSIPISKKSKTYFPGPLVGWKKIELDARRPV